MQRAGAGSCTRSERERSVDGKRYTDDLSGNVWEWEDSCFGYSGHSDPCRLRGGSFSSVSSDVTLRCDYDFGNVVRGDSDSVFGFRCCSDP